MTELTDATDQLWDKAKPVAIPTSSADIQQLSHCRPDCPDMTDASNNQVAICVQRSKSKIMTLQLFFPSCMLDICNVVGDISGNDGLLDKICRLTSLISLPYPSSHIGIFRNVKRGCRCTCIEGFIQPFVSGGEYETVRGDDRVA